MDEERHYLETTIHIREGFEYKIKTDRELRQENDRSLTEVLTEVLTEAKVKKMSKLLEYIEQNGEVTPGEASKIIGKSTSTTYRYLATLVDAGVLTRTGSTNNLIYKLNAD